MNNKAYPPQNQPHPLSGQHSALKKEVMDEGKPIDSGINQPHNAKKEGLGPNTNR